MLAPTHPYWLTLATPHVLVQGGIAVPDDMASELVALFDHHHRLLGRNEPMVSGWALRPVKEHTRQALQLCEQSPLAWVEESRAPLRRAATALDEACARDDNLEAFHLGYVYRDRRTSCATPQSFRLLAPRAQSDLMTQFFIAFTSACMQSLSGDPGPGPSGLTYTCYGWSLDRQMEDPFVSPGEIVGQFRRKLAPLLRNIKGATRDGAWDRVDAVEADIQALLLQSSTPRSGATAAAQRL